MRIGIVLYAHGARDPRWAEPFQRLRELVERRAPHHPVSLAFLEHMSPSLTDAVRELAAGGVERIRVVPIFFGRGGHLREGFPRQLEAARLAAPSVEMEVRESAGENEQVLLALADFVLGDPESMRVPRA